MTTTVLGIDPGVSETGWAVVDNGSGRAKLVDCGLIKTSPRTQLCERLRFIHSALAEILARHKPHSVAVEEMFFLKAAHTIRGTLQARGVVLLAAAQAQRPISEYNPRTVKISLTGSGRAAKLQMQQLVRTSLGLTELLKPDDVSDAAAIALCHLRFQRVNKFKVLDRFGGKE